MNQAVPPWQRARARAVLAGALALACGAALAGSAHAATPPPSAVTCSGHSNRGVDKTTPDQIDVLFACSGDVKSFTVISSAEIGGFEVSADVFQHGTTTTVESDSFFCEGPIPGDGFNCTGQALVGHDVHAAFELSDPACGTSAALALPLKLQVVVSDANGATAGPFRLRGPEPCTPAKQAADKKHRRKHRRHRHR